MVTQLSQPTLSRLIKQLEDDIGVELIDRYHRPLQLTAAGLFFYDKVDSILKELESSISLTQKIAHPPDTLNIGFVPSVLYGLLPTIISRTKQRLPNLAVHLKDISSFKQVGALKAGEIDVGFGRFSHDDASIKQLLLRHERYVAALPAHPFRATRDSPIPAARQPDYFVSSNSFTSSSYPPQHSDYDSPALIGEPLLHLFAELGFTASNHLGK